ncbi:RNase adapter RapZ [Streptomyces echinoruber]|uniref:RapZ-like N-terminal domain-containing protein n=1 Tax=Streptomyces echinoruber TaxID=68898 RepID=A0A918QYZ1_9ACTN|nr:RNase adapter RapZ [Streptomyces echinoruber]GGZ79373.1 hypothetical protein GCM10010389_16250 [Streptomyces echinoruber]
MPSPPGSDSRFVVITGLSGAGRSLAADHLADPGRFTIDTLPPEPVPKVAEPAHVPRSSFTRVVPAPGTAHQRDEVPPTPAGLLSSGARARVLFLEAATDVLVQRHGHTRRRHPPVDGDEQRPVAAVGQEPRPPACPHAPVGEYVAVLRRPGGAPGVPHRDVGG